MRSLGLGVVVVLAAACGNSTPGNSDGGPIGPDGASVDGWTPPPPGDGGPPNGKSPNVGGCDILPPDNPWNRDVSGDPLRPDSAALIAAMAPSAALHPDWGTFTEQYGIPINVGVAPPVKITWTAKWGPTESDKLACPNAADGQFCYPIGSTAKIEGGPSAKTTSDRHALWIDTTGAPGNCTLYELYNTQNWVGPGWTAANGAIFPLGTNALRTLGWTSADAAGLPVMPGLARLDEIKAGQIRHALRFTMNNTRQGYIKPATHAAGNTNTTDPPMGLRVRLKASVTVAGASPEAAVLVAAMKKYGLMLADNGSDWYISGETNDGWTPVIGGILTAFGKLHGSDFEVVDTGPIETTGL